MFPVLRHSLPRNFLSNMIQETSGKKSKKISGFLNFMAIRESEWESEFLTQLMPVLQSLSLLSWLNILSYLYHNRQNLA